MDLIVIMKRTFDTEDRISIKNGLIDEEEAEFIINPYDEYAIEEAILLREKHGGEVKVVTVGDEEAEKELRTALAMGADKAVLIDTEDVDVELDHFSIAEILTSYLKTQDFDMILGGNLAIDDGSGQVAPRVARKLDINLVTTITKIEVEGDKVTIERDVEGDVETVETTLPVLVTCQQGLNEPRYPSLPGIMKAKKKPLETIDYDDLDLEEEDIQAKSKSVELYLPPERTAGRVLKGDMEEQAKELVELLKTKSKVL
ncbi:electron transfer flavoprotein subunit beta [Salipaludibacillus keqinensis]|uniref:Electron transfer flavoprotein subunit beta n=1 Tax=Salipaludibacillus keqinensis TaxID=2045207 RepID=A0A323TU79_9BACI|nr:electron transfer flavoprotein subunit beta/FixA family protein [Salipaludibacillus keqinensis]PYZ92985.1 electron transfer flavoprotein subunit beta [Salipaludibacillus keqinensis]